MMDPPYTLFQPSDRDWMDAHDGWFEWLRRALSSFHLQSSNGTGFLGETIGRAASSSFRQHLRDHMNNRGPWDEDVQASLDFRFMTEEPEEHFRHQLKIAWPYRDDRYLYAHARIAESEHSQIWIRKQEAALLIRQDDAAWPPPEPLTNTKGMGISVQEWMVSRVYADDQEGAYFNRECPPQSDDPEDHSVIYRVTPAWTELFGPLSNDRPTIITLEWSPAPSYGSDIPSNIVYDTQSESLAGWEFWDTYHHHLNDDHPEYEAFLRCLLQGGS